MSPSVPKSDARERPVLRALSVALLIACVGVVAHVARNLSVHVPAAELSPQELAALSEEEACRLEHRTLTGVEALKELGVSGLVGIFSYHWLVLFASVLGGCLIYEAWGRSRAASRTGDT